MAAPAFAAAGTYLTGPSNTTSAVVDAPAGIALGDLLLVHMYKENTAAVTMPSGWAEVTPAPATTGSVHSQHLFWKRATATEVAAATFTFSWTGSAWREAICERYTGVLASGSPFDATNSAQRSSAATPTPPVTVTTTSTDRLLVWSGSNFNGGTWTVPSGFTGITTASHDMGTGYQVKAAAGSTGSITGSCSSSANSAAWLVALLPAFTLVPVSDSGSGDLAVDLARTSSITDSGTTTDPFAVLRSTALSDAASGTEAYAVTQLVAFSDAATGSDVLDAQVIEFKASSDSGVGAESIFVDIPDLIASVDSATGNMTFVIAPVANSFETGTGTESFGIARTSSVTDAGTATDADAVLRISTSVDAATGTETVALTAQQGLADSGIGSESFAILRFSSLADAGVGAEVLNSGPYVFDGGVGHDELTLVDIPFTQILPLRQLPVYDLVVVGRVQQVGAAPSFIEIDPIEWKSLTYTNTLSQPQELSASCQISSLTESVLQRLRNLAELATELWLFRNGKIVFAGPVLGFQTSGEDLTISCKGLLAYLRLYIIENDITGTQLDQNTVVKTMVDQWQASPYGNYGIDTSGITPSGTLRDVKYLKTELHNVGQRVEDIGKLTGGFDAEVDPATRKLLLWSPTKGVDRSSGEDAIVIDERNITSGDIVCSVAIGDLASDSFATGTSNGADTTLYSTKFNAELRSKYGRSAITQSFSDVSDQATLDAYASALIAARGEALLIPGPKVRVTPDADLSEYAVGDTIAYELGSTLSVSGSFRIRKQAITASSTGQESVDLEFV